MVDLENPLTEQDKLDIDTALDNNRRVKSLIEKAKRAGFNFDTAEEEIERSDRQLRQIKQNFFPNG